MKISKIDRNFAFGNMHVAEPDIYYYDVKESPFRIYGVLQPSQTEDFYRRLPTEIALSINEGVAMLYKNTSGGRIRFRTDSPYVAIRAEMSGIVDGSNISLCGGASFDLYSDTSENTAQYIGTFVPP